MSAPRAGGAPGAAAQRGGAAALVGGQELATIVNNPSAAAAAPWYTWRGLAAATGEDWNAPPPALPPGVLPEVHLRDFERYLRLVGDRVDGFERDRASSHQRLQQALSPEELVASQGQGLVAAMREVPSQFFQEGFSLDRAELWEEVCDVRDDEARQRSLERLSHYLDVVETHLVREIAARSDNFFSASGYVQDVGNSAAHLHEQVAALRSTVHEHEQASGAAAQLAAHLQRERANVLATMDLLKGMEGVAQAQVALQALLPEGGGLSSDYAGVIDVLEVLQSVLDDESLLALGCFSELPQQIVEAAQAVDDLMTADFIARTRFLLSGTAQQRILDRLAAQLAAARQSREGSSPPSSRGMVDGGQGVGNGSATPWAAVRLTNTTQLECVAAWVGASPGTSGEGVSDELADLLLPLVVGLLRMDRLSSAVRNFNESSTAALKDVASELVERVLDALQPTASDHVHLLASPQRSSSPASSSPPPPPSTLAERLQQLPGEHFVLLLEAVLLLASAFLAHCQRVAAVLQASLAASQAAGPQVAAVARECKDCSQLVAEAAAARWSKLLSARANGAQSVRLGELREVLEVTDVLAAVVERHGVRGVLGLRSALQQLCKSALDGMHARCLDKLAVLLEQEQWGAVEVHAQFQQMVERLETRAQAEQAGINGRAAEPATAAGDSSIHPPPPVAVGQANGGALEPVARKFTITPHDAQPASARTLVVAGTAYHVVDTELVLISMLGEYLAFRDAVPAFAAEVAQRVLELLKVFNSRTCQLVLGAGAMQVSGLKSITAKHLAVSCQCLGALMALHPALVEVFTHSVAQPRRGMLEADFGRALQDYRIHHNEVTGKLVSIMRERLSMNIKQLPALAATWPDGPERADVPEPSAFASTSVRQLQILRGVLEPLLLPAELHSIFGRIALMFSRTLAEAYTLLEPHGGAWEQQLRADVQALLNCLSHLPMVPEEREAHISALTQLFEQRFVLGAAQHAPALPPPTPALDHSAPAAAHRSRPSGETAGGTDLQPGQPSQLQDVPSDCGTSPAAQPAAADDADRAPAATPIRPAVAGSRGLQAAAEASSSVDADAAAASASTPPGTGGRGEAAAAAEAVVAERPPP